MAALYLTIVVGAVAISTALSSALLGFAIAAAVAFASVLVAERLAPFERWRDASARRHVDLLFLAANGAVAAACDAGLRLTTVEIWPRNLPFVAQLVLAILVAELGTYWAHRAIHASRTLYRFHAVHHSPRGIDAINSGRFHPLDFAILHVASTGPLLLLGVPPAVLVAQATFAQAGAFLQHANIAIDNKALGWIFHTPALHRRHHAVGAPDGDRNFGGALIVWDVVFGTRRRVAD
jgi:sterol desaturase/sphingolipid hydroxylase (fatty acid hydroxylase superfamily)